jgi:hypothetical protein
LVSSDAANGGARPASSCDTATAARIARIAAESLPRRRILVAEDANPPHLPCRLRLGGERRREEAERYTGDERPPVHYSIT